MTKRYVAVIGFAALLSGCSSVCPEGDAQCADPGDDPGKVNDDPSSPASAGCQLINNPDVSLEGFKLFLPNQKRNNLDAGDPSYVYLGAGEGVIMFGPEVARTAPLQLHGAAITLLNPRTYSADGYRVVVNETLSYAVSIDDFEYEVALALVEVCDVSDRLTSHFVFSAAPGASGVAHDITITSVGNTTVLDGSEPVTVEVR